MKICTKCNKKLSLDSYYKGKLYKDGYRNECKECNKKHYTNTDKRRTYLRKWNKSRNRQEYYREYYYNLTTNEYNKMIENQNNRCAICNKSFTKCKVNIDHCHKNGHVRGLLCHSCNTSLGKFKDDINNLINAINYLEANNDY